MHTLNLLQQEWESIYRANQTVARFPMTQRAVSRRKRNDDDDDGDDGDDNRCVQHSCNILQSSLLSLLFYAAEITALSYSIRFTDVNGH